MTQTIQIRPVQPDDTPRLLGSSVRLRRRYGLLLGLAATAAELMKLPLARELAYQLRPDSTPTGVHPVGLVLIAVFSFVAAYTLARIGLWAGRRLGLGWPPLEGWDDAAGRARAMGRALLVAAGWGVACAAVLLALGPLFETLIDLPPVEPRNPYWSAAVLGSVAAGVGEEIVFRLGLLTLFAWYGTHLAGRASTSPAIRWGANVAAALAFGAVHLPQAAMLAELTAPLVALVMIGNGLVGLVFGWLYWRRGLVAAMVCHSSTNVVARVLVPLFWV